LFAVIGLALPARADYPRLQLHAGATCLRREQLRLEDWIDADEVTPGLSLEVRGSSLDPRSAEVILRDARGELGRRSFAPGPERCADLHHALALASALLIRAASRTPRVPLELELGARALLSASAQVSAGARLHVGIRRKRWQLALAALALRAKRQFAGGDYRTRVIAGGAEGCVQALARRQLDLRWCAGVWVGQLRAEGLSFAPSTISKLRWAAFGTGPTFSLRVRTGWWLSAQTDFVLPLLASEIVVRTDGGDRRQSASRPALLAGLGLAYRFER
jgi:hypothetical protein